MATATSRTKGATTPKSTIPNSIGGLIDLMYTTQVKRLALEKEAAKFQEVENSIEALLLEKYAGEELNGAMGKLAKLATRPEELPTVKAADGDWDKVYTYILRHKDFSILQKRLSTTAIREIWKQGRVVPGVSKFTKIKVSLTKR